MIRLTVQGDEKLKKILKAASKGSEQALAGPLRFEAERIMTDAKLLTPVDTNTLRASGVVQSPDIHAGRVVVELGFGGAAKAYALVQHERTDFHHTSGQAKFLEQPVKEAERGFGERISRWLELF